MPSENIYAQFARPVRSVGDYIAELDQRDMRQQQLDGQRRQNMIAEALARQQMQGVEDQRRSNNVIRSVYEGLAPDAAPDARFAALRRTGERAAIDLADAQEKAWIDRQKGEAEARSKQAETMQKVLATQADLAKRVMANPTREAAAAALANMRAVTQALGIPVDLSADEQAISRFTTPEEVRQWAYGHALKADDLLPKISMQNAGGSWVATNTNAAAGPVGAVAGAAPIQITQSADNAATNATSRANNAASVGAQYANANAAREQASAVRDAARITARAGDETALRKEFGDLPEVKKFKQAAPAYKAVVEAAKINNPQADINLIYGLAKLYDPESVVREGEYDTIANSQAIPEWLKGQAQRLMGGGRLTAETKKQILQQAKIRYDSLDGDVKGAQGSYGEIAKRRGLDPANVFPSVGAGSRPDSPLSAEEQAELKALRERLKK